jgi:outer membrane autotransporter protein
LDLEFNPYAALQVVHLNTDSYTLTSSATTVSVGSVDTTSVRLTLAAQLGKRWSLADGSTLKINVRGGWVAEFADTRQNTSVSALGGTVSFNTASNSVGRNFALVGANAHYQMGRGFGLLFDYRLETNRRSTTHGLLGGIRYVW